MIGYPSNVGSFTIPSSRDSKAGTVRTTLLSRELGMVKLYQHLQP
jgi:hypothetical protein